jgi:large subunit ribosomal protein L35
MPKAKLKTRKGMADRIRVTRNGKLVRRHAWKSHLLEKKSAKRKRAYRSATLVSGADATEVRRSLGI